MLGLLQARMMSEPLAIIIALLAVLSVLVWRMRRRTSGAAVTEQEAVRAAVEEFNAIVSLLGASVPVTRYEELGRRIGALRHRLRGLRDAVTRSESRAIVEHLSQWIEAILGQDATRLLLVVLPALQEELRHLASTRLPAAHPSDVRALQHRLSAFRDEIQPLRRALTPEHALENFQQAFGSSVSTEIVTSWLQFGMARVDAMELDLLGLRFQALAEELRHVRESAELRADRSVVEAVRDRLNRLGHDMAAMRDVFTRTQAVDGLVRMESALAHMRDTAVAILQAPEPAGRAPPYLDENVQFTVYRPGTVRPAEWYPMLAFAHLSALRPGEEGPEPLREVEEQAAQILGERAGEFHKVTQDSSAAVPREGEITFVPTIPGLHFNPPSRTFLWLEPVHREEFRFLASPDLDGQTVRGRMSVFLGSILLADLSLGIRVDSAYRVPAEREVAARTVARPYRSIFASYSRKDLAIVAQFERYARTLGDRYLRDLIDIRAGEVWDERLEDMIRRADIFQLFWSWNSMRSPFVRREWEYALSLRRPHFVRPTYWEEPFPESRPEGLPPQALQALQFERVQLDWRPTPATETERTARPPAPGGSPWPHQMPPAPPGVSVGTPAYMEPEQAAGGTVDWPAREAMTSGELPIPGAIGPTPGRHRPRLHPGLLLAFAVVAIFGIVGLLVLLGDLLP
jgi:hypothetical protein